MLASLVGSGLGALASVRYGWSFFHEWSLGVLVSAGLSTGALAMHVRSFRTLTDAQVKAYVGSSS